MSLATEFSKGPPAPTIMCGVAKWITKQPESDQKALREALSNPEWKTSDIHKLIREHGFPLAVDTLRHHRAGGCSCGNAR